MIAPRCDAVSLEARTRALAKVDELERDRLSDLVTMVGHVRVCRSCGCTDAAACWPNCWWVEADLCSLCPATAPPLDVTRFLRPPALHTVAHALQRAAAENA